jgi:hypothetical protein
MRDTSLPPLDDDIRELVQNEVKFEPALAGAKTRVLTRVESRLGGASDRGDGSRDFIRHSTARADLLRWRPVERRELHGAVAGVVPSMLSTVSEVLHGLDHIGRSSRSRDAPVTTPRRILFARGFHVQAPMAMHFVVVGDPVGELHSRSPSLTDRHSTA